MRPITWTAALLALFVATEANAQHYTIAKPIYMPHQLHDPCSICGGYCNGSCSLQAFFAPTVTVNGCPIATSDSRSHSIVNELAYDIQNWIYSCRANQSFNWYCFPSCDSCGETGCEQSRGSCSDECTPLELTSPQQLRDEDVDPFRDDSAETNSLPPYHTSSLELNQPEVRIRSEDPAVIQEAPLEQNIRSNRHPPRGDALSLIIFTSPFGARSLPTATMARQTIGNEMHEMR